MKMLFVPFHITGLSCNGIELNPDAERLVNVPDERIEDLKGHGLLDPEDDAAMQAYADQLNQAETDAKEAAVAPARPKPSFKKAFAKHAAR